jgi:hypothetical protein
MFNQEGFMHNFAPSIQENPRDKEDFFALAKEIEELAGLVGATFVPFSHYRESVVPAPEADANISARLKSFSDA